MIKIESFDLVKEIGSTELSHKSVTFVNEDGHKISFTIPNNKGRQPYADIDFGTYDMKDLKECIAVIESGKLEIDLWKSINILGLKNS